jgi:hypothetical protein
LRLDAEPILKMWQGEHVMRLPLPSSICYGLCEDASS